MSVSEADIHVPWSDSLLRTLHRYSYTAFKVIVAWYLLRLVFVIVSEYYSGKSSKGGVFDEKVEPYSNGVHYPVSYWSEICKRPYQEDRHQELQGKGAPDSSLYGVFDGHGGYRASQYCREVLLQYILADKDFLNDPVQAMRTSFFKTDAEFSAQAKVKMFSDGTTAVVALVHNRTVYCANAGDSRCILVKSSTGKNPSSDPDAPVSFKEMSFDHKPDRPDEEARIKGLGGKVIMWGRWRVQGVLAVSRAIGDVALQPYVTCEPEILTHALEADDALLVLASDGVWDVLSNEDVARVVLRASATKPFLEVAKELCLEAIMLGSADNVTAQVVDLSKELYKPEVKEEIK